MQEMLVRAMLGGIVVSSFALLGDVVKPKSFAGLFGAAPSVALATLALAVHKHGPAYGSIEGRSMILGAIAFFLYGFQSFRLRRKTIPTWETAYYDTVFLAFVATGRTPNAKRYLRNAEEDRATNSGVLPISQ